MELNDFKKFLKEIPYRIIIYEILPYLQYEFSKNNHLNIKTLLGYFKYDYTRKNWLIWRGLYSECTIKLIEYPHLISLTLLWYDIDKMGEDCDAICNHIGCKGEVRRQVVMSVEAKYEDVGG